MSASQAHGRGRAAQVIGVGTLIVAVAVLAWNAGRLAEYIWAAAHYPYQLDYGEGPLLSQIGRLAAGEAIYRPLGEGGFTIANYPPTYHGAVLLLAAIIGNPLLAGRLLSGGATFACALLVGLLAWRASLGVVGGALRALAASAAGLLFLGVLYVYMWAPLLRVDMLALSFTLSGVFVFSSLAPSRRATLASVFFVLALFTKQTAAAGAAACVLVGLWRAPRVALRLLAASAAAALLFAAVMMYETSGWIFFHLIRANSGQFVWENAVPYLSDLGGRYPTLLALAVVSALSMGRRGGDNWARPVLAIYLLTASAVSVTVGKTGAHVNYLLELMAVTCACVGAGLAEALGTIGRAERVGAAEQVAAIAFPALVLLRALTLIGGPEADWADSIRVMPRAEAARVVSLIEGAGGPVLSQDMTLLTLAHRPIEYQPFEMTQLARLGAWDPAPFLAQLAAAHFALIVLEFDAVAEPQRGADLFTPAMLAAIDANYARDEQLGPYLAYRPRLRAP